MLRGPNLSAQLEASSSIEIKETLQSPDLCLQIIYQESGFPQMNFQAPS